MIDDFPCALALVGSPYWLEVEGTFSNSRDAQARTDITRKNNIRIFISKEHVRFETKPGMYNKIIYLHSSRINCYVSWILPYKGGAGNYQQTTKTHPRMLLHPSLPCKYPYYPFEIQFSADNILL